MGRALRLVERPQALRQQLDGLGALLSRHIGEQLSLERPRDPEGAGVGGEGRCVPAVVGGSAA